MKDVSTEVILGASTVVFAVIGMIAGLMMIKLRRDKKAEEVRYRDMLNEVHKLLAAEKDNSKSLDNLNKFITERQGGLWKLYDDCVSRLDAATNKLSLYENHPNEVVRMALYPKQKLVVSTPGCLVAGGGAIIDFEGALELDGEVFQMENPVKMRGKWSSEGLVMFPLDPTQDIPAMDKLEVFIYAV